jgi:formate hydrogenlyase subunit 6/NADH:ubiquinone oxidoreductase subunit I
VEACPTKALKLVSEKELTEGKRRLAAQELVASTQKSKESSAAAQESGAKNEKSVP